MPALYIYLAGMGFWLLFWVPCLDLYDGKLQRQRTARYILATPIWPIMTIIFIIRGFIELVRMAR